MLKRQNSVKPGVSRAIMFLSEKISVTHGRGGGGEVEWLFCVEITGKLKIWILITTLSVFGVKL